MSRVTYGTIRFDKANMIHVLQFDSDTKIWYDRVFDRQEKFLFELYTEDGKLNDFFTEIKKAISDLGVPEPQCSDMVNELEKEIREHTDWGKVRNI